MQSFDIHKQTFTSGAPYEYTRNIDSIASACTKVMEEAGISYWLDIGLLTEYPKWYGTSFNTVVMTLLAVALFIQEKKVPLEVIINYSFQYTHIFADICYFASYIKYLTLWSVGSCLPFVALHAYMHPVFQIWTVDFSAFSQTDIQNRLRNLSRLFSPEESEKKAMLLYHLFIEKKWHNTELPIDIAIIHMWASYESLREKEQWLTTINSEQLVKRFTKFTEKQWVDYSLSSMLLSSWDVYRHASSLLYVRLFHACIHALQGEKTNESVKEIIMILKDMSYYHWSIEHEYEMISLLTTVFFIQKTFPEEICAFLPMTTVKTWGTFLAVIPRHGERKTLEALLTLLHQDYWYSPKLLFASWKEEYWSHGGVALHQYISEQIFSSYITPWTVQITYPDGKRKIGEYDILLVDNSLLSGITFDMIKRKVLVKGEKVNHKVLCSQSATIEIMMYLLDHIDEFIPNHLLPPSAYSKTKNEMVSKILLPLQDIMKNSFWEKMEIICTGTMYEWTICLKKKPQSIYILSYTH